jgi:hypothetical protein
MAINSSLSDSVEEPLAGTLIARSLIDHKMTFASIGEPANVPP